MRISLGFAVCTLLVACSCGKIDLGDAGPGQDATSTDSPSPPPPGTDAAPPPPTPDSGPDCSSMAAEIDAMQKQAETCCPICNTPQCDVAVQGVCCPFSVTGHAPAGFDALVAEYKAACHPLCPAIPCPIAPSKTCKSIDPANPSAQGICQ
jgi:hypothetical protein